MKKCDEQVKIVDEQARGRGNPAELTTERLKKVWTELTKFNRIIGVGWNVESIKSYQKISMAEFLA